MKINRATDYGIRLMMYLAARPGTIVPRAEVAQMMAIPAEFLAKIAQLLAKAGFIEIRKGRAGGYILARDPSQITLLDLVETLEGEISLNLCVERPEACSFSPTCKVHLVWQAARKGLRDFLASIRLTDLIEKSENSKKSKQEVG